MCMVMIPSLMSMVMTSARCWGTQVASKWSREQQAYRLQISLGDYLTFWNHKTMMRKWRLIKVRRSLQSSNSYRLQPVSPCSAIEENHHQVKPLFTSQQPVIWCIQVWLRNWSWQSSRETIYMWDCGMMIQLSITRVINILCKDCRREHWPPLPSNMLMMSWLEHHMWLAATWWRVLMFTRSFMS